MDCSHTQKRVSQTVETSKKKSNRAPVVAADVLACDVSVPKAVEGDGTKG